MCPSTGPVLYGSVSPARIACLSRSRLCAKGRNCRTEEARTSLSQLSRPSPRWWQTPVQEAVGQLSCLCEGAIHLAKMIQLLLRHWARAVRGRASIHPMICAFCHVFERRARDWTNSNALPLASVAIMQPSAPPSLLRGVMDRWKATSPSSNSSSVPCMVEAVFSCFVSGFWVLLNRSTANAEEPVFYGSSFLVIAGTAPQTPRQSD